MKFKIIIFAIFSLNSFLNAQDFRNDAFQFTITYPSNWVVKENQRNLLYDGTYKEFASVSINAQKLAVPDSFTVLHVGMKSIREMVENDVQYAYDHFTMKDWGRATIDGKTAFFFCYYYSDFLNDFMTKYVCVLYVLIHRGFIYTIFTTAPEDKFDLYEKNMQEVVESFRLLNKKIKK